MSSESCCTCASLISPPTYNFSDEQKRAASPPRQLPCCSRVICADCTSRNPRFAKYCPFCQVSDEPSALPQGLKEPPAYDESEEDVAKRARKLNRRSTPGEGEGAEEELPSYTPTATNGESASSEEDTIHHLHSTDTLPGLALAYSIPLSILRQHNGLFSDGALPARRTLRIPAAYYTGPSLSATPVESEEETERKRAIRRFMVRTKCVEYAVAELYLGNESGDVDRAVKKWEDDEKWERENPLAKKGKGKGRSGLGGGLTGQLG